MNADGTAYRLTDFLLFSERTYYRLFERFHAELGAVNGALFALGLLAALALLWRHRYAPRIALATLALAWAWSAAAFVWRLYAPINWVMDYALPVLALQIAALAALAIRPRPPVLAAPRAPCAVVGWSLLAAAMLAWPCLAPLTDRGWAAAELFGSAPDPTALGSVGIALLLHGAARWVVLVVPLAWCVLAGLTLLALAQPAGWLLLAAPLLAGAALLTERLRHA